MRALLLFAILILLVAGAFLYQQMQFGTADAVGPTPRPTTAGDEVVFEIGGQQPGPGRMGIGSDTTENPEMAQNRAPEGAMEPAPAAQPAARSEKPAPTVKPSAKAPQNPASRPAPSPALTQQIPDKANAGAGPAAAPTTTPENAVTLKLGKGDTIYKLALKYYGSGSMAVMKDIAAASRIADPARVAEGAMVVLPAVAGGATRRAKP